MSTPKANGTLSRPDKDYQSRFFTLTVDEAKKSEYDIIIVGTGIGGGVLASDLYETNQKLGKHAKNILVIEKGDLIFHSHCLNAARPAGLGQNRGQQNDTFFADFRDDYKLSDNTNKKDWKGGPMHCLGGRSAAWGLFLPRIHDDNLRRDYHSSVSKDLLDKYYYEAECLMNLSLPKTKPVHQNLLERLNVDNEPPVAWQWGRIASEFAERKNFDFAEGAYSTIDKLLTIAMSKTKGPDGKLKEHEKFKMLLGTEVRRVVWDKSNSKRVVGVSVRTEDGKEDTINVKSGGTVVLAAGSVTSPTILLRSGVDLKAKGGLHITDHDIISRTCPFRYKNPKDRLAVGSMKLQTYSKLKNGEIVLVNMSIDASSFLPRGNEDTEDTPVFILSIIREEPLNQKNTIELADDEPVVTINRARPIDAESGPTKELKSLTTDAMKTIESVLEVDFIDDPTQQKVPGFFQPLEMGGVAHELGSIPMRGSAKGNSPYCVDETLKLDGYEGVYVCDLSVFPSSPEVNPTLTLAALSLRLSRHTLAPRLALFGRDGEVITADNNNIDPNTLYVVNHASTTIKVWASNRAKVASQKEPDEVVLEAGEGATYKRKSGIAESVAVFRLQYGSSKEFLETPEVLVAKPGTILAIQ